VAKPFDFGRVELDIEPGTQKTYTPEPETPFRILVLGNFSGATEKSANPKPVLIDRDNFDGVMNRVAPSARIDAPSGSFSVSFRELDDFHPDRLFQQLEIFRSLRHLRDQLGDPTLFQETAQDLEPAPPPAAAAAPDPVGLASGSLLENLIEATETRGSHRRTVDPVLEYARKVVAPYTVPKTNPKQSEMITQVDRSISEEMRALLGNPALQAVEGAWRALYFLVRNVDTGPRLKIYMLDTLKSRLTSEALEDILLQADGDPWSLMIANYSFGADDKDPGLLQHMAALSARAGAPLLAAAALDALGNERWQAMRRMPSAEYVGLALPRFLLRLPYGKDADAPQEFAFEEMPKGSKHDAYLWGNPAFICGVLIAQSFSEDAWQMRTGSHQELRGFPVHVYRDNGDSEMKPCAELWLTQSEVEQLLDEGFMPLISIRGSDSIRVARIQSIAPNAKPLAGRWNS
jgi:type VI secretion system protein ImpC